MLAFFLPHAVVAVSIGAYVLDRQWAFALPTWTFLAGIVVDQLFGTDPRCARAPQASRLRWRLILYLWAPLHAAAVLCGLHAVANLPPDSPVFWSRLFAISIGVGMVGGTLGGAIAHEFMHAPRTTERIVGVGLMSLMTYGHFTIGHVAGHHRWVGTDADPATARRGESLYGFLIRTFAGGAALAWRAERTRLRRRERGAWSVENRLLQIIVWQAVLYACVFFVVGWVGVLFFALQGFIGASLLEVMNYIMHYGLRRNRLPSGRLEAVQPHSSWNTSRLATTYLMCGIGLHSYHHCRPSKRFPLLTLPPGAPELPGGLFAMFVLAWFPPLWRSVMDPLADFYTRGANQPRESLILTRVAP
ncbi:MAG TPA: alkane 1-monooxygenase [Vicinamibacterales bacterium]|nr:alkane 1-monooxygenase [Vicinamibacterales bacterium]